MGSKSSTFEAELLAHIFVDAAIPYVGDAAGLPPAVGEGSLYVSLHTDPALDDASIQTTSETAYDGYVRKVVPRNSTWWDVTTTAGTCYPAQDLDFVECTGTPGAAITHFAIGKEADGGAGGEDILYWGTVTPNITMAIGVIPRIKTTSTITED
jgi:hypothetical protein